MSFFNIRNQQVRSLLGIAAMTLFQLLIFLALGAAIIRYLEWSSEIAQAEFLSKMEAVSDPRHSNEPSTPVQSAKERGACNRKG
jgi:hypothetical protein